MEICRFFVFLHKIKFITMKNTYLSLGIILIAFFSCKKKEEALPYKFTLIQGTVVSSEDNKPVANIPIHVAVFDKTGTVVADNFDILAVSNKPATICDAQGKFQVIFEAKAEYTYGFYANIIDFSQWTSCFDEIYDKQIKRNNTNKDLILKIAPKSFFYFVEKKTGIYDTLFTDFEWKTCDDKGFVYTGNYYFKGHFNFIDYDFPAKLPFTIHFRGKKNNKIVTDNLVHFQGTNKGDTLFYPISY